MVANGMDIGGAETHVVALAKALTEAGHTVSVASPKGVYTKILKEAGIKTPLLPLYDGRPGRLFVLWRALLRICRQSPPDIIHAHARSSALCAWLVSRQVGVPLVTTAHLPFESKRGCGFLSRWGEGTLAVSRDIAMHLEKRYKQPRMQIKTTLNGIEYEKFCPRGEQEVSQSIVHVSRLDSDRAATAAQLIQIAPKIAKEGISTGIKIVGDGALGRELQKKADTVNKRLGRPFINMVGATERVEDHLTGRPIFIGVSRAALEAMAAECTVILSGNEGYGGLLTPERIRDFARENFCCRSEKAPTSVALFDDISRAARLSVEERRDMGKALGSYVRETGTPRRMREDAEEIYRRVLRSRRQPAIIICGYHGYGNWGDELSLPPIIRDCQRRGEKIVLLHPHPKEAKEKFGVLSLHRYRLVSLFQRMKKGDILVFAGGNLFQNQTGMRSLLYYTVIALIGEMRGCRTGILRGGIGEVKGKWAKRLTGAVLKRADFLYTRTPWDNAFVRKFTVGNEKRLFPDAILATKSIGGAVHKTPYATVILRPPLGGASKQQIEATAEALMFFAKEKRIRLVLLPFHPDVDGGYILALAKRMPGCLLLDTSDERRLRQIIGGGRATVTNRLHAGYLSIMEDTPCLFIIFDKKTEAHVRFVKACAKKRGIPSPLVSIRACTKEEIKCGKLPQLCKGDYARLRGGLVAWRD